MEKTAKLAILTKIANELNAEGITWAIGSSSLLYLKGLVDEFNDFDLFVKLEDTNRLIAIFDRLGKRQPDRNDTINFSTIHFLEYIVDDLEIDIMADFGIKYQGQEYIYPVEQYIVETYDLNGTKIPMTSLKMWQECYRLMGRVAKADLLDEYFNKQ